MYACMHVGRVTNIEVKNRALPAEIHTVKTKMVCCTSVFKKKNTGNDDGDEC